MVKNTTNVVREQINVLEKNLSSSTIPGATRHELLIKGLKTGDNIIPQIVGEKRSIDDFIDLQLRNSCSVTSKIEVQSNYLARFIDSINDINSELNPGAALSEFLSAARDLSSGDKQIDLGVFLSSVQKLKTCVSGLIENGNVLILEVGQEINSYITRINQLLKEIQGINTELIGSDSNFNAGLIDEREEALKNLAKLININAFVLKDNSVVISTSSGMVLVSGGECASIDRDSDDLWKLSYGGLETIKFDARSEFTSGKIGGLLDVKNNLLPKQIDLTKSLAKEIASQVNKVHNKGSAYPGKTTYKSSHKVDMTEILQLQNGKTLISIVDDKGLPVKGEDGLELRPLCLDFNKLNIRDSRNGNISLSTIADEINQYFNIQPTQPRYVMGETKNTASNNVSYLLNDIKMIGTNDIDANNNITFGLELDNSSDFNTQLNVLEVYVNTINTTNNINLPNSIRIDQGDHIRTDSILTLNLPNAGENTIDLKISILGDNGKEETKWVRFNVDPKNKQITNKRILVAKTANATYINNRDYITQKQANIGNFAKVSVVDEDNNPAESGYFSIKTTSPNYRIVIQDESSENGLSYILGLNNFFKNDSLEVRDDIAIDPANNLSMAKLSKMNDTSKTYSVGNQKALLALKFENGVPQDGDTLTISGAIFTFKNAAVLDTDIAIGIDTANQIQNIMNKLSTNNNTTKPLNALFDFESNNIDTLTITCKIGGIWGNNKIISWNLVGGATINTNANANNQLMTNGSDKNETKTYASHYYKITNASREVMLEISQLDSKPTVKFGNSGNITINSLCKATTNSLIENSIEYENRLKVQNDVHENLTVKWKNEAGTDTLDIVNRINQLRTQYESLWLISGVQRKLWDFFIKSLFNV